MFIFNSVLILEILHLKYSVYIVGQSFIQLISFKQFLSGWDIGWVIKKFVQKQLKRK